MFLLIVNGSKFIVFCGGITDKLMNFVSLGKSSPGNGFALVVQPFLGMDLGVYFGGYIGAV